MKTRSCDEKSHALNCLSSQVDTHQMSRLMTKQNKWSVRPAKIQFSLGIHPVWPESLLCAQLVAKDPSFLHADSEDSDQTGRMLRLIWVFAGGAHAILLVLSCRGSNVVHQFSCASQFTAGIKLIGTIWYASIAYQVDTHQMQPFKWATSWENLFIPYATNRLEIV